MRVHVRVCVCLSVCMRESVRMCVCVFECVYERECACKRVCVCLSVFMRERKSVCPNGKCDRDEIKTSC